MKFVDAPTEGVFRVSRGDRDVFSPADWRNAGRGRFDDPIKYVERREHELFRTVYCATHLTGSFVETLQTIQPLLTSIAELDEGGPISDRLEGHARIDLEGAVPVDWRTRRHWGRAQINTSGRFVDVVAAESVASVRNTSSLARLALELRLDDIDISAIVGPKRALTQAIARHIYTSIPDCCGIRYVSRFSTDQDFECWAAFDDRVQFEVLTANEPVLITTPGFEEAMKILQLYAEYD